MKMARKTETIVFGGGCFWCTQAIFDMFDGVKGTMPGYAGGHAKNPTYEQVCTGNTGHAEVLRIEYDPSVAPLEKLLDIFFTMHDPTSKDQQGADVGTQYRSIILYTTDGQKKVIGTFLKKSQKNYDMQIRTEVKRLDAFYPAEDYHKKFYQKNPLHPYCIFVTRPKIAKVRKKFGL